MISLRVYRWPVNSKEPPPNFAHITGRLPSMASQAILDAGEAVRTGTPLADS